MVDGGYQGPSPESWQRDVHELGFGHVKILGADQNSRQERNRNDNVQEFKDLFATGMEKIT